jgi:hypothetical protein
LDDVDISLDQSENGNEEFDDITGY